MKIAYVHSYYSPDQPSGENTAVDLQAEALRRRGHDVVTVARRTPAGGTSRSAALGSALTVSTGMGASPVEELNRFQPDVVHVHNLFPNWGSRWLTTWSGPVVATLHNYRSVCAAGTLHRDGHECLLCPEIGSWNALCHRCYRDSTVASLPLAISTRGGITRNPVVQRAQRIVLLSDRSRDVFARVGIPAAKVDVVPNFATQITPTAAPGVDAPWVFVGRLTREKGVLELLDHWPADQPLTIYGSGPLEQAVSVRVRGRVTYAGALGPMEAREAIAAARGLVFPSTWAEGAPMVYVEALAAGRPVIARSGNSVADDVAGACTGVVYEEPRALSNAIDRVNARHQFFADKATTQYAAEFSENAWSRRMEQIYTKLSKRTTP